MKYAVSFITLLFAVGAYYLFKKIFTGAFTFFGWEAICFVIIWQMNWLRIALGDLLNAFYIHAAHSKVLAHKRFGALTEEDFKNATESMKQ